MLYRPTPPLSAVFPRRLALTMAIASLTLVLFFFEWRPSWLSLLPRVFGPAAAAVLVYSLTERWPRRLPRRLNRWVLQVTTTTATVLATVFAFYQLSNVPGEPPFWEVQGRLNGFFALSFWGMLISSWTAFGALLRDRDALIASAERKRGEIERQALDARLRLLQAQVEPHFLFNTLSNIQGLVDSGSPRASTVLSSLITYLRAAVPRLNQPCHNLGQELEMVKAYLSLMHLRMPDRLTYKVESAAGLEKLRCSPMALMTLVENAIQHGIDPSLEGGRVELQIKRLNNGRCLATVLDTGVGLKPTSRGLGTGLVTLRERLKLTFDGLAELRMSEVYPHGILAEIEFPAQS